MFVGYYLDRKNSKLFVSERIRGQRFISEFPLVLEYYLPDKDGYYVGYDGNRLKKIECSNYREFQQHKFQYKDSGQKTYELNFNLPNKVLYQQYKQGDTPKLHISFCDIEVDRKGMESLTVKELIDKACCPINAISIYNDWQETLYTLMLRPETLSKEEAETICKKFDNTILFDDESQLLKGIIALLQDCDVFAGWNSCVATDTPVWLNDRILPIRKLTDGSILCDSNVIKVSDVNVKDEYRLMTKLGNTIFASKDHIFPVSVIDDNKYVSKSLFETTMVDKNIGEIIDLQNNGKQCFVKISRHNNMNKSMTYRDYILNNLDWVLSNYDISFENMSVKIDYKKSRTKQKCYSRIKDIITRNDVIEYIRTEKTLKIFSNGVSGHFNLTLDEVIDNDFMHLCGLIYTDGSITDSGLVFYNSNKEIIDRVETIFNGLKKINVEKTNPYHKSNGVFRRRITKNNKFGFLMGFIYNNGKHINTELLSLLSREQFMSFFSGCVDGDGWISDNSIGFCNYNNDILNFQELLLWNGILSAVTSKQNVLNIKKSENRFIKPLMDMWVDYKHNKMIDLEVDFNNNKSSSKAIDTRIKDYGDFIYVRLNRIEETGRKIDMMDICTDTHYFYARGIKTHNCHFDTPYIVRRINNVLGKEYAKQLCLFDQEPVYKEKMGKFGDVNIEYEIVGKWFTDYMLLYIKHEQGRKESYSLNSIASIELGEEKVKHTESLDDMYRNRYEDFIKYNRQDTMLVKKLEDKMQYIAIHNEQAHDIRCSLESTMGTVAWVDQALINEAHDADMKIPDRDEMKNNDFLGITPPGAFVPTPKTGLANWIVSYDMNSLYPTTMRSLNLSPEMIVAQVKLTLTIPHLWDKIHTNGLWKNIGKKIPDWGAAWAGDDMWGTLEYQEIMKQTNQVLTVKFDTGEEVEITAKELYDMIFADGSNLSISAAGTIFKTEKKGLLNKIFTRWYAERKGFKKEMFKYEMMAQGVKIDEDLAKQLV